MMHLYYGLIKTNANMIISINVVGCVIEVTYLMLFVFYAYKKEKMATLKLVLLFNVGYILTMFLLKEQQRVNIVGWICAAFSMVVFVSPLSIMAKVIRTKRVEFLPICLSLFLIPRVTTWFLYGLLIVDMFIAVITHTTKYYRVLSQNRSNDLYMIYKDAKTKNDEAKEKQINNAKLNTCRIKLEAMVIIIPVENQKGQKY